MNDKMNATVLGGTPALNGVNLLRIAQQGRFPTDRSLARREILARTGVSPTLVSRWIRGLQMVPKKYCGLIGMPIEERALYLDETLEAERERLKAEAAKRQRERYNERTMADLLDHEGVGLSLFEP